MPFCPNCRDEFMSDRSVCTICATELVSTLENTTSDDDLIDCYICYDALEAKRLLGLLTTNGMEGLIRDRSCSPFPTHVGMTSEQHIAVKLTNLKPAIHLIQSALSDGVISTSGQFRLSG